MQFKHISSCANDQSVDLSGYVEFRARPDLGGYLLPIMPVRDISVQTIKFEYDNKWIYFTIQDNVVTIHTSSNQACRIDAR